MLRTTIAAAFVAAFVASALYVVWLTQAVIVSFAERAASLSLAVCGGLPVALAGAGVVYAFQRQRHEARRQRDGAWAIEYHYLVSFPRRVLLWLCGRPIPKARIDPNAYMGHALVIADAVYEVAPAAGWDRQLAYAGDVERTNRVRAAAPGDGVLSLPWASVGRGIGGVANAATGRLLAGAYDPKPRPVTIDAQPSLPQLPPPAELTPQDAVQQSKPAALVLGQTDGGEPVAWDMTQTPHLRVHGMTRGAGKTGTIQLLAAEALRTGAHVVVFDPARLKDWGEFRHCAELVDASDPGTLADGAARLLTIYHNRSRRLAQAGAGDIAQMPSPPQRIVVVIAEFGAQCELARADGDIAAIVTPLLQLARKAAATGIHLLLEDQVVDKWPRGMAGNSAAVIGRMPLYAAQACGFVPRRGLTTDTFERGQFWFGGQLLRVPHAQPALRELLADVPAPQQLVMLTPAWKGVEGVSASVRDGVFPEVETAETAKTPTPPANGNTGNTPDMGKWYEYILDYMERPEGAGLWKQPAEGVRELARVMSVTETGNEAAEDSYVGIVSKVAKRIRNEARLPSGARLGTDITGGA